MADEINETTTDMAQPIIVDMGKQKSSNLKDLKKGQGKLWDEVLGVVEEARDMLGEEAGGKVLLPVVIIYQKKPKRSRLEKVMFPLMK